MKWLQRLRDKKTEKRLLASRISGMAFQAKEEILMNVCTRLAKNEDDETDKLNIVQLDVLSEEIQRTFAKHIRNGHSLIFKSYCSRPDLQPVHCENVKSCQNCKFRIDVLQNNTGIRRKS